MDMAVDVERKNNKNPKETPLSNNRRFETAGEAAKELFDGFNDWCGALSSYSIQVAYAILAANWAVHGTANAIWNNIFAKLSMALVILFLGLHLLGIRWMALLYKNRSEYANTNKQRWEEEFHDLEKINSPWPYTECIQKLGLCLRILKTWAPVIGGALFILSLFIK